MKKALWIGLTALLLTSIPLQIGIASASSLSLVTAPDYEGKYSRSAFKHWIDEDKNGCNTRAEVLIRDAIVKPKVGKNCVLIGGKWRSQYDKLVTTNPSALDIDHLVPLAEAWRSGAWAWTNSQRRAFANDLEDSRALVAVSASSNRSKGDRDVSQWQPKLSDGATRWIGCNYLKAWIAIKMRYALTVDQNEAIWINTGNTTCAFGNSIKVIPFFTTSESSPTPVPATSLTPSPSPDLRTKSYIYSPSSLIGITYKDFQSSKFSRINRHPLVSVEVIDPPSEYLTEDLNDSCVIQSTSPESYSINSGGVSQNFKIFEGEQLKVFVRCRWILGEGVSGASWKWRKGTSKLPLRPTDCAKLIEVEIEGFKALQCVPSATASPKSSSSPSATSGGVKRCWVDGYTRSNGTPVKGYYRSC